MSLVNNRNNFPMFMQDRVRTCDEGHTAYYLPGYPEDVCGRCLADSEEKNKVKRTGRRKNAKKIEFGKGIGTTNDS